MHDKRNPKLKTGWLACAVALALAGAGQARADQLTATLVNPEGRPSTLPVVIHVDRYSTEAAERTGAVI